MLKQINIKQFINKRVIISSVVFSVLLSISFVIGNKVNLRKVPYFNELDIYDLITFIIILIEIFFLTTALLILFNKKIEDRENRKSKKSIYFLIFFITLVLWLPYFFIYYPGIVYYDSLSSIQQALNVEELNNHHPVLFTLLIKLFIRIGTLLKNVNLGVALFSLTQMMITSATISYCIYYFYKRGAKKILIILGGAFFCLNPVIAMYSITMFKDILFSNCILLLVLILYDTIQTDGKIFFRFKGIIFYILLNLLIAFMRNNGIYIIVLTSIPLIIYLKQQFKKMFIICGLTIIGIVLIQSPIYKAFNIKPSNFAESVGIPLQQLAYSAKFGKEFTQEQKDFINELIGYNQLKIYYDPYYSDSIKFMPFFNNDFLNENKMNFLKIWFEVLPMNFSNYLKSYLVSTAGYYHIGTTDWVCRYIIINNPFGIYNTDLLSNAIGINIKEKVSSFIQKAAKTPVYSISLSAWITFFYCTAMIVTKKYKYIIPVVPLIAIWLTLMIAAPTFCEFRYMLPLHLSIPFLFLSISLKDSSKKFNNKIEEVLN